MTNVWHNQSYFVTKSLGYERLTKSSIYGLRPTLILIVPHEHGPRWGSVLSFAPFILIVRVLVASQSPSMSWWPAKSFYLIHDGPKFPSKIPIDHPSSNNLHNQRVYTSNNRANIDWLPHVTSRVPTTTFLTCVICLYKPTFSMVQVVACKAMLR